MPLSTLALAAAAAILALGVLAPWSAAMPRVRPAIMTGPDVLTAASAAQLRERELPTRSMLRPQRAYRAVPDREGFALINRQQRLTAQLTPDGAAVVRLGATVLSLRLVGVGYGQALGSVGHLLAKASANRVTYARPGLREWYADEPGGIEQGFTLASPPARAGAGSLTLALALGGNVRPEPFRRQDSVTLAGAGGALAYRGLLATDAQGNALPARLAFERGELLIRIDDRGARYPIRIDPFIGAAPASSPYAQAVLADNPAVYYRLDEPGGPVALDSSPNGQDGAYQSGVTFGTPGAIASDPGDTAISSSGLAVTQSGTTLPSGDGSRTVEFWLQGGIQNPVAVTYGGGGGGTNDQFRVEVNGGQLWLSVDSSQLYTSGQYVLNLPQAWWNGDWHLFDVTYDGTSALGYMDGQLVGNFGVRTPLATVLDAPLRIGDRADVGDGTHTYGVDEFAIYPSALSPARIDAHWTLGASSAGACAAAPTSPYAQTVLQDAPSLYLRLDEAGANADPRVAYDGSGQCTAGASTNGSYLPGVKNAQGATFGDDDTGITATGLAVTQFASTLPAGNSPRTLEFWIRGGTQNPIAFTYGGSTGTNDQFRVELYGGQLWLATNSSQSYASAQYVLDLPEAWWDGNWHLFDVTYDGATALGYMDGQLVGSFGVLSPLATTLGSPLRLGDRPDLGAGFGTFGLDEFAIYPTALSAARIDAHWTAQDSTPPGMSIVAGTANLGSGGGAQGARVQACPTSGGSCVVDPYSVDQFGLFHFLVPNGTYTITIFPPYGSPSAQDTIGPLTLPPNALNLSASFAPPGGLGSAATFTTPGGTQQNTTPVVNWGTPSTYTVTACPNGTGMLELTGTNTSTGQQQSITVPLRETPPGSGTYQAQIPPLAPIHGVGTVNDVIDCPPKLGLFPSGGDPAGGNQVLLNAASGLTGATAVHFGSTPATSFQVLNDNFIAATAPAGTGSVAVTVTSASGGTIQIGTYTYLSVASLSTGSGSAAGGTSVTINGQGFQNGANVLFGLVPAQSVTYISPTQLQAVAPAGVGTVDVKVVQGNSLSAPTAGDQFVNTGGPPGTSGLDQATVSPDQYAQEVSNACESPGMVTADDALCRAAHFSLDIGQEVTNDLIDKGFEPLTDFLGEELGSVFTEGVIDLTGSYAAGALAFDLIPVVGEIALFYQTTKAMIDLGNDACKALVGTDCRWDFWNLFIDPNGTVVDTNGNPISGATATLLGQSADGSFAAVDPASGVIRPATNPETTGASGSFDWDALAGTYKVEASAPGCSAPGDSTQPDVFTSPFTLPPPALGLVLTLNCPGSPPPPAPTVTGVEPGGGSSAGGNTVDITGTALTGATAVHFGNVAATQFQILSPYAMSVVAPAGSSTQDVTVTTTGGTSATSSADQYTFVSPSSVSGGPTVSGVSPSSGPLTGGTLVTITGTNLGGAFEVDFGGTASSQVTDVSSAEVQAVAPAAPFSTRVDITVTTSTGTSSPVAADMFTYGSPPQPPTPAVSVSASPNPVTYLQQVTLTATVSPTDGGGTVAFYDNGSPTPISGCASQPLTSSRGGFAATCSASTLAPGSHTITAAYSGDASYESATGSGIASVTGTPANVSPPSISGVTTQGQTLTETHGTWTNLPTSFSYQWQVCDATGGACIDIAGATMQAYTLTPSDVGHTIRVEESATNGAGTSAPAGSGTTGVVTGLGPSGPPANSLAPAISGSPQIGQTLTTSAGAWSGALPITFSYHWQLCRSTCADIGGATGTSYKLPATALGDRIQVQVTASNPAGTVTATSTQVGPVGPSTAQVNAALSHVLVPSGKRASIGSLLAAGGYPFSFSSPSAGKLTIGWYFVPRGAHLAKGKPRPVLVAAAHVRFTGRRRANVMVRLTGAGRRLLARSGRVAVTSKAGFAPAGVAPITRRRTFILRR